MIEDTIKQYKCDFDYLKEYEMGGGFAFSVDELKKVLKVADLSIKNYKEEFSNQSFLNIKNSNVSVQLLDHDENHKSKQLKHKAPKIHRIIEKKPNDNTSTKTPEYKTSRKMSNKKHKHFINDKRFEAFEEFDLDDLAGIQKLNFPVCQEQKKSKKEQRYHFLKGFNQGFDHSNNFNSGYYKEKDKEIANKADYHRSSTMLSLRNQLGIGKEILSYHY